MARPFVPKIISANDLLRGDVVYLSPEHLWSRDIDTAALAQTDEEAQSLLEAADQPHLVVGPYLIDIEIKSGARVPVKSREIFRERGPSNRTDLGRQADSQRRINLA